jgi:PmbA protein
MSEDLHEICRRVVESAGAGEQIDVMLGRSRSTTVRVYEGEVESFTSAENFGIGIRVIKDGKQGFASAGSLDDTVVRETLAEARDNCPFGEFDEFLGLAEPDGVVASAHDHWNPDLLALSAERKIEQALELERLVRARDPRVTGVRTAAWSDSAGEFAYAASNGIVAADRGTSCSVGVQALIAADGETQTGAAGDAARSLDALDIERVVSDAVDRGTRLLGATQPASARLPIVLEPRLAITLLGLIADLLDGESVQKGRSPFAGRVGEQIASPLLTLVDDPTAVESIAASEYDGEGLACRRNPLIAEGVLGPFLQNSYTARKAQLRSTGSALRSARSLPGVGAQVLVMGNGSGTAEQLRSTVREGLFVNSLQGLHSGVNPVSGDFSVGADGLMIRDGELAEPVREITLASTLQRLLLDIIAVGGDREWLSSGDAASTLVIGDVSLSGR